MLYIPIKGRFNQIIIFVWARNRNRNRNRKRNKNTERRKSKFSFSYSRFSAWYYFACSTPAYQKDGNMKISAHHNIQKISQYPNNITLWKQHYLTVQFELSLSEPSSIIHIFINSFIDRLRIREKSEIWKKIKRGRHNDKKSKISNTIYCNMCSDWHHSVVNAVVSSLYYCVSGMVAAK